MALKLEADVFELVGCHKEDCSVSQVDYSCAAIWHKIMGSWSLAKAGEAGEAAFLLLWLYWVALETLEALNYSHLLISHRCRRLLL